MLNKFLIVVFAIVLFSCNNPIPRKPILRKTTSELKESVSFNKSLVQAEENAFKKKIKNDSLNRYFSTSKGFWYTIDFKSKNIELPKKGDIIEYTYAVFDINNKLIYAEDEIGLKNYVVDKQEIIEGLRDGLKLMHEGDIFTFLFPSHKVFGYLGDQNKIGINEPLIYRVKLNKLNKKNENN